MQSFELSDFFSIFDKKVNCRKDENIDRQWISVSVREFGEV